ncbi:metallophosphoesterase [Nocardiopsis sp. RSe5-2]|uniref:Metallophosphoesterase n=1 Tax=Nocardiopsis endophytica TaxID=3018445 RepID=A0ABT4UCS5_9ACTN|nr:metallophosphoesterase [Nocardiopsis endophytica]MDA2814773.1 metallophosphoesterase [Nocardiopsis endophytica]
MPVLAHISDTHFDGSERSAERARRAVDYIGRMRTVDAVVHTGDVVDKGAPEEYAQARETLRFDVPLLVCPGNHDAREAMRAHLFGGAPEGGPVDGVHRLPGATVITCDTSVPRQPWGRLEDDTLDMVESELRRAPDANPVLLAFHHPPVDLGSDYTDPIRQRGEQRLAELVGRRPEVVAMLCGHVHTASVSTFAGRPLLVAPSVASTLRTDWEPEGEERDAPVMIAIHHIGDDGRVTSHFRAV